MFHLTLPKIGPLFRVLLPMRNLNFTAPYNLKDRKHLLPFLIKVSKASTSISYKSEVSKVLLVLCHSQKAAARDCLLRFSSVKLGTPLSMNSVIFGYVHTVPDRFLLRFKCCSDTVCTRINALFRSRDCSKAFPV